MHFCNAQAITGAQPGVHQPGTQSKVNSVAASMVTEHISIQKASCHSNGRQGAPQANRKHIFAPFIMQGLTSLQL